MSRDRLIDRLAKLLALALSPNVHEAEAARTAADRLMREHGLTREDAARSRLGSYCEVSLGSRGFAATWRLTLAAAAARYCGAELLVMDGGQGQVSASVAGPRHDVDRAVEVWRRLRRVMVVLEKMVARATNEGRLSADLEGDLFGFGSRSCLDAFRRGAVLGIVRILTNACGRTLFGDVRASSAAARPEDGAIARVEVPVEKPAAPAGRGVGLDDVSSESWFLAGAMLAWESVAADGDDVSARDLEEDS